MEDCLFCKIVRMEIPAEVVYEDDVSIAFLDINPVNEGHVLLIPKEHHSYMQDTPDNLVGELFIKAKELMIGIKKSLNAFIVTVSVVGTDISHFHIHIAPRFKNDGLKNFFPTKKYSSEEAMKRVGDKIRTELILKQSN